MKPARKIPNLCNYCHKNNAKGKIMEQLKEDKITHPCSTCSDYLDKIEKKDHECICWYCLVKFDIRQLDGHMNCSKHFGKVFSTNPAYPDEGIIKLYNIYDKAECFRCRKFISRGDGVKKHMISCFGHDTVCETDIIFIE